MNSFVPSLHTHTHTHAVCTCVRAFVFHGGTRVSTYTIIRPRFVSRSRVWEDVSRVLSARTHTHTRALTPDRSRHRTIFERGKERSRTNFLHNFGSPRADSNFHYYSEAASSVYFFARCGPLTFRGYRTREQFRGTLKQTRARVFHTRSN